MACEVYWWDNRRAPERVLNWSPSSQGDDITQQFTPWHISGLTTICSYTSVGIGLFLGTNDINLFVLEDTEEQDLLTNWNDVSLTFQEWWYRKIYTKPYVVTGQLFVCNQVA